MVRKMTLILVAAEFVFLALKVSADKPNGSKLKLTNKPLTVYDERIYEEQDVRSSSSSEENINGRAKNRNINHNNVDIALPTGPPVFIGAPSVVSTAQGTLCCCNSDCTAVSLTGCTSFCPLLTPVCLCTGDAVNCVDSCTTSGAPPPPPPPNLECCCNDQCEVTTGCGDLCDVSAPHCECIPDEGTCLPNCT